MQAPRFVHPVHPIDPEARRNGCTCNHRSSIIDPKHGWECAKYRKPLAEMFPNLPFRRFA